MNPDDTPELYRTLGRIEAKLDQLTHLDTRLAKVEARMNYQLGAVALGGGIIATFAEPLLRVLGIVR